MQLHSALDGSRGLEISKNSQATEGSSMDEPDVSESHGASDSYSGSGPNGFQRLGAAKPQERWIQGCIRQYLGEGCAKANCEYLHDLGPEEVAMLVQECQEGCHVLYGNSSEDFSDSVRSPPAPQDELQMISPASRGSQGPPSSVEAPAVSPVNLERHKNGTCQPCFFFLTAEGCNEGAECRFCHLEHGPDRKVERPRLRPCKAKRARHRKLLDQLKEELQTKPGGFDPDTLELPKTLSKNAMVRRMFVSRLMATIQGPDGDGGQATPPNANPAGADRRNRNIVSL